MTVGQATVTGVWALDTRTGARAMELAIVEGMIGATTEATIATTSVDVTTTAGTDTTVAVAVAVDGAVATTNARLGCPAISFRRATSSSSPRKWPKRRSL